jgi:hypothetical protein
MGDIGASIVAFMIGALLITFLVSRLIGLLIRRWVSNPTKLLIANFGTLMVATVLGGYGFANGEQPLFSTAFFSYVVPVMVWLVHDLLRWGLQQHGAEAP